MKGGPTPRAPRVRRSHVPESVRAVQVEHPHRHRDPVAGRWLPRHPPGVGTIPSPRGAPLASACTDAPAMSRFLDSLLQRMTLEEKLGQLNQPGGPGNDTGPAARAGSEADVRAGHIGSFLGVNGAAETREFQRIAVEQSRRGIPLLFGHDVIRDDVASITRPVKELRGFRRITLPPGESRMVAFVLHPGDLSFHGPDLRRIVEPGTFTVFVGTSSEAVGEAHFEVAH